jgi:hypothetical protein
LAHSYVVDQEFILNFFGIGANMAKLGLLLRRIIGPCAEAYQKQQI